MPPDLNSLPPSRSTSSSPLQPRNFPASSEGAHAQSPSPRSSSVSLAAAATMNAADLSRRSSRSSPRTGRPSVSERRRSAVAMNLNLNDPSVPGPGELPSSDHRSSIGYAFRTASPTSLGGSPTIATGDPHHQRAPSLGEIHQELEQEQEAQVNRLLQMIRNQQIQLQQMQQQQQQQSSSTGTAVIDDSTPTSERSVSFPAVPPLPTPGSRSSLPSSLSARRGSRPSSQATSPSLRPVASNTQQGLANEPVRSGDSAEWSGLGGEALARRSSRDEGAFYQAETAMLTRENQLLRQRIRELERQISELTATQAYAPPSTSNLATAASTVEGTEQAASSMDNAAASEETEKT